jgi:AcrR family transcriptional regulator
MSKSDTSSTSSAGAAASLPRVGRPPTIDAEAILGAALEIGLEGVTLKQVADRLGVAISTLYRHVRSRDELVQLAASQQVLRRKLPKAGDKSSHKHWTEVAIHHAESLFESFVGEPQLITEFMKGRLGPEVEVDFLEQFLALTCPHGLTPAEGIRLYRAIGMLTLGGAIGTLAMEAAALTGTPQQVTARRVLAEREPAQLPLLRQATQEYISLDPQTWRQALSDLISGIALSRGEQPLRPDRRDKRVSKSSKSRPKAAPDQTKRRGKQPAAVPGRRKST